MEMDSRNLNCTYVWVLPTVAKRRWCSRSRNGWFKAVKCVVGSVTTAQGRDDSSEVSA